jgi:O-antigen/teichoic acid export membrane protein
MSPYPLAPSPAPPPTSPGEGERLLGNLAAAALRRDRARRWLGILSAYFSTQTVLQLLGFATGVLLIRSMPVREFALYTLAFSVVTFFNFITDLGSTTSLLHFYHRAAREGEPFEPYLAAVLSLRRAAFLLGASAVVIAFPYAAAAQGYGGWQIALVTVGIVAGVWFQIQTSIRLLTLRLHDRYARSYRAEVGGTALRLLLAGGMVATRQLAAWIGVAATAVSSGLSAALARPEAPPKAPDAPAVDLSPYRRRVVRFLLPTLPSALYFAVQGPLLVWLSATFGSTRTIAEVGALGRLGLAVGMFSSLIGIVFLPRLARIVDERHYLVRFLQFGALLLAVAGGLLAFAALFPRALLFVLGAHYSGLNSELLLVIGGAGLSLLDGYLVSVNIARSWTRWQTGFLIVQVATQAGLIALFPLTSTYNVLRFNFLSAGLACGLQTVICTLGFTRPHWVRWS